MLYFSNKESWEKMLKLTNVIKAYKYQPVLNISSMVLEDNKFYGVVGPNGAGKTTLFKCITNVVNNYTGEILLDGKNIKDNPEVLAKVGLVLDGMSVYANKSGWFNIKYFAGLRESYNEERVMELASSLKLTDVLNKKVLYYSYGMKKKLIMLIALMNNPKLLILDEPFRGLDIETVDFLKDFLKKLQKEGITLLISSHVHSDIEGLCDEVIIIDNGQTKGNVNIHEQRKKAFRMINTSDNIKFIEILDNNKLDYEIKNEFIRLDIGQDNWHQVYNEMFNSDVLIEEMSRINAIVESLQAVKKGVDNNEL